MVDVNSANIDELKGLPDVEFDFGVASALKSAFRAVASTLEGQRGSRASWRSTGLIDFQGHFSQVFTRNGQRQLSDLGEVARALRDVATKVESVEQAAREENQRRRTARDWAQEQAHRNWVEKGWDSVFGGDDPPAVRISDSGPSASVPAKNPGSREAPAPGADGGRGGGTSSARPSNLRSFAANTQTADSELSGAPARLDGQVSDFAASCRWATLDASGPIRALRVWLRLNGEDGRWATTVADAFARAGGEGNVSTLSDASIQAALAAAHVAVNRSDIQVDPATAFGSPPTTGYSNDPINTATGNFIENESDLGFTGPASVLALTRSYNSLNRSVGAFGRGWSSWAEAALALADDAARLRLSDGREIVFPRLGDGWDRAAGENVWLCRRETHNGDGPGFTVTSSTGMRWEFAVDGRLVSTSSGPGTRISFSYNAVGRLVAMTHELGRAIGFTWDRTTARITEALATDGRRVRYHYDDAGRLTAAVTPAGIRRYRWNDADLIEAVVDADGVVEAENSYDEDGRVVTQRSPFGRLTRFAYLPGGVTSVSDQDGTRSNTWISDGKGRLIGVIDAEDHRQSTSYDRWGNPVMITERDGSVTINSYDDWGRRTGQVTPSGARISYQYDDLDRPTVVTVRNADVDSITRYGYEADSRNPARVIDPEGGVTLMTWEGGLLKQVVDPEGVTLRFAHDDHGDLVATIDADGNVARLERDDLGRVVEAITPLGHRTTYRYDGFGPLLSRQDPDGAIWRYEHSAGGRLTAVIDPTGGRTEFQHGDHGEESRTIDPLGRTVSSTYDDLGNRVGVELPDGSRWQFGFDAMSRLIETVDPAGGRRQLGYDAQGHLVATVDPTGVERIVERNRMGQPTKVADRLSQTTADYDALGRTVAETGPDGSTSYFRYDRCGRLLEHTDPTGATTRIQRDKAGRPGAVTHPMGSTYRYEYDRCGRRSATIDTDGTRYGFVYDGDGRLVREDWPTGELATVRYDACGRVAQRYEPGRGVSRYGYDKAGRLVRVTDGWHGRRSFRYDAAGQLVGATHAAGGETRFEYDELGRCTATIDPLGGRTERRFDAMGRVIAETDALGRTTRFAYDAAGRPTRRTDPTGSNLAWTYDNTGRLADTHAGDRLLSTIERDVTHRTLRIRERDAINELTYDRNGRLIGRTRGRGDGGDPSRPVGGIGLSWSYDGDGRRTAFTRTDGTQTRYEYDRAGRVSAVEEPGLGRAVIDRDSIGRIVSMAAPGLYASWTWDGGAIVRHQVVREGRTETTEIERDIDGRVVAQTTDGLRTAYAYDAAGELIEARRSDGTVTGYSYDAGGRLVRESTDGRTTSYLYDRAGQLLSRRGPDGSTEYGYDAAGRRITELGPDGERRFGWDPRGFLARITTITHGGDKIIARTRVLEVDGLGELAQVDGQSVAWDTAAGTPALAQVGPVAISNYGPLTALLPDAAGDVGGVGAWLSPEWRPRSTGADPWGIAAAVEPSGLPSGVAVGAQGSLLVDGMEWMQARVYDPASRGFLSADPLEPVLGAGWAGNPYSFAGNDPLNQSDPWGLRPVTDAELQAYRDANNGALSDAWHATTSWLKDNWEYIAAGALIVGGIAVMATGVGGPIGAAMIGGALLSGGLSAGAQKVQNGSVNWGQVAVDGAMGAIPIPGAGAAGAVGKTAIRTVATDGLRTAAADGARTAAADGARTLETQVARSACFVAGTQVLMGDGSSKNIEDVQVGDEVTAADPETGETHAKRVVDSYVHQDVPTYDVRTTTGSVISTEEHPFYVEGKGWVPVRDLQPGDALVDPKGSEVSVVSVEPTGATATVHNFHVEGLHTYHVEAGDVWVRVHNTCTTPRADFIVGENGTVIPTSRARLEAGLQDAHLPNAPTRSPGTEYTLSDGSKVRVMDASGQAPQRASFTNGNGQPVDAFTGKPPQPPPGLTAAERKAWVRERTHVELGP